MQAAADVHQAACIGGDETIGAGRQYALHFVVDHIPADARIANGERTTKAAALILMMKGHQLGALHMPNQRFGFGLLLEHAQVTGEVVSNLAVVLGSDVGHLQLIDQKIAQFEGAPKVAAPLHGRSRRVRADADTRP